MEQIGDKRGDGAGAGRRNEEEGDDGQGQRGEERPDRSAELVVEFLLYLECNVLGSALIAIKELPIR